MKKLFVVVVVLMILSMFGRPSEGIDAPMNQFEVMNEVGAVGGSKFTMVKDKNSNMIYYLTDDVEAVYSKEGE